LVVFFLCGLGDLGVRLGFVFHAEGAEDAKVRVLKIAMR
jgi:hypothetical protein